MKRYITNDGVVLEFDRDASAITRVHPLALVPDYVCTRGMTAAERRLLAIVVKAVEAAENVLDEHGPKCEAVGCEVCRHTRGLLWSLEMAHGMIESQLPVR